MEIKNQIQQAIADVLIASGIETLPESIHLEYPADMIHGDYATNVALQYARMVGKSPKVYADSLLTQFREMEGVSKIEVAGPGFINFTLAPSIFAETIQYAQSEDTWGSNTTLKSEKIIIEYTSPNLFKPLHIGNLVGNILGESLARLMQFGGAQVIRANYPSDIGLTVAKGVWGLIKTNGDPKQILALGEAYRVGSEAYENDPAGKTEIELINKKLYDGSDTILNELRAKGITTSRESLDQICRKLGTEFDLVIFESEAAPIGLDIVKENTDTIFEKSDGAIVLSGLKSGVHTRVFVNSAGLPTYEAKDLGNFDLKHTAYPDATRYYVVTGGEQKEYFKVIIEAIKMIFPDAKNKIIAHIATGFLTLTTGKMSSRKGNVLTGESLLNGLEFEARVRAVESRAENKDILTEQIAVAAIKYQILKQGASKDIIFDLNKALSMEGDSGPYLQYCYARTCAIMQKADEVNVEAKIDATQNTSIVMRLVSRFPEMVLQATDELEPHIVAQYLLTLASAFNSWYANEQILDGTTVAAHKVAITNAVNRTLKNGLWLLGIPAPEKM